MEQKTLLRFYDSNKSIGFIFTGMDSHTMISLLGTMKVAEKKLIDKLEESGTESIPDSLEN